MKLSTIEPQVSNITDIYESTSNSTSSEVLNTLLDYNTVYSRLKSVQEKLTCLSEWAQLVQLFVINKDNNLNNMYDGLLQMKKYLSILMNFPGQKERQENYESCKSL